MRAIDAQQADKTRASLSIARLARLWAAGTGIAVALVVSAYLVARQLAIPLIVAGAGEVTLDNVIGFTVLGAMVGAVLAVAIERFSRRPRSTFLAMNLIALAGYAVVPFTATESIGTALWLNLFHLVVGVPVIGMLARGLPWDRSSARA